MSSGGAPELSVVLTVVDGEAALVRALGRLREQEGAPALDIIVPYDNTIRDAMAALAPRFPFVRFVDLGDLCPDGRPRNEYEQHAIYDRRRAGGLRAAAAPLVAMLEDRALPAKDWAGAMVKLHAGGDYAVVGGSVENGASGTVRWALFFCDFGRFQPPLDERDPEYVTDINLCYRRDALEGVRDLWEARYFESQVNWALRSRGGALRLSDEARVVLERKPAALSAVMRERVHWGRIFGEVRGMATSRAKCLLWAAVSPAIPTVLLVRHLRRQRAKGHSMRPFVRAIPAMALLLHCWVLGELLGYFTAAARPRT